MLSEQIIQEFNEIGISLSNSEAVTAIQKRIQASKNKVIVTELLFFEYIATYGFGRDLKVEFNADYSPTKLAWLLGYRSINQDITEVLLERFNCEYQSACSRLH